MTRRERILKAIDFAVTDQVPRDLGGMASTGISCFAYPALVEALGLPPRLPRVFDTGQMLALPDEDVLDALDCDCVHVSMDRCTNAFVEPERWHPYDFNSRLLALVMSPSDFVNGSDGSVSQGNRLMVPDSYVFDAPHGGENLDLSVDPPKEDLEALRNRLAQWKMPRERVESIAAYCRRARESTDRAIMFTGLNAGLGFRRGMASFSMLCMLSPDYVAELHSLVAEQAVREAEVLLPEIAPYVDILMLSANDLGTQNASILPPAVFQGLFVPAYRTINDAIHAMAPSVRTFLHSCGAVFELLDGIVDAGFDVLNPVQWCAGGHGFREWKEVCDGRIALWGGGIDTQHTLPLGNVSDVVAEVQELVPVMSRNSGFVFCAIHNLLAEISPEKIIAMYRAVGK